MASVQSVERALDLLVAVADAPAGLMELARRTELPVSTTSRLLSTLEARRAVTRLPDGSYEVGSLLASSLAFSPRALEAVARLHVGALADLIGEAVAMSVPQGQDSLTVLQADTPKPVQVHDWSGARWPLTAGGSGLVMLATWTDAGVDAVLREPLRECTPSTCIDPVEIRRRLARIVKTKVSWSKDEYVEDLTSVAAAIVDPEGSAIASVQIYGPSYRFPGPNQRKTLEAQVLHLAERISEDVFRGARHG